MREEKNALMYLSLVDEMVIEHSVMRRAGKFRELFRRENKKETRMELYLERLRVGRLRRDADQKDLQARLYPAGKR